MDFNSFLNKIANNKENNNKEKTNMEIFKEDIIDSLKNNIVGNNGSDLSPINSYNYNKEEVVDVIMDILNEAIDKKGEIDVDDLEKVIDIISKYLPEALHYIIKFTTPKSILGKENGETTFKRVLKYLPREVDPFDFNILKILSKYEPWILPKYIYLLEGLLSLPPYDEGLDYFIRYIMLRNFIPTVLYKFNENLLEELKEFNKSNVDISKILKALESLHNKRIVNLRNLFSKLDLGGLDDINKSEEFLRKVANVINDKYKHDLINENDLDNFIYYIRYIDNKEILEKIKSDYNLFKKFLFEKYLFEDEYNGKLINIISEVHGRFNYIYRKFSNEFNNPILQKISFEAFYNFFRNKNIRLEEDIKKFQLSNSSTIIKLKNKIKLQISNAMDKKINKKEFLQTLESFINGKKVEKLFFWYANLDYFKEKVDLSDGEIKKIKSNILEALKNIIENFDSSYLLFERKSFLKLREILSFLKLIGLYLFYSEKNKDLKKLLEESINKFILKYDLKIKVLDEFLSDSIFRYFITMSSFFDKDPILIFSDLGSLEREEEDKVANYLYLREQGIYIFRGYYYLHYLFYKDILKESDNDLLINIFFEGYKKKLLEFCNSCSEEVNELIYMLKSDDVINDFYKFLYGFNVLLILSEAAYLNSEIIQFFKEGSKRESNEYEVYMLTKRFLILGIGLTLFKDINIDKNFKYKVDKLCSDILNKMLIQIFRQNCDDESKFDLILLNLKSISFISISNKLRDNLIEILSKINTTNLNGETKTF